MAGRKALHVGPLSWRQRLLAALCAAALGGCWSSQPAAPPTAPAGPDTLAGGETAVDDLVDLMRQRLLLMHDVARWKWNEAKPITDPDREQQLLAELEQRGLAYGLDRQRTRAFMMAQIEAGKLIQERDFAGWKEQEQGKFAHVPDLNTELRPLIDELSDRMLAQLAQVTQIYNREQAALNIKQRAGVVFRGEGIDDALTATAMQPLLHAQSE